MMLTPAKNQLYFSVCYFIIRPIVSTLKKAMSFLKRVFLTNLLEDKNGEKDIQTRFDDVAGAEEAKEELKEIVDFLKNLGLTRRLGDKCPKASYW